MKKEMNRKSQVTVFVIIAIVVVVAVAIVYSLAKNSSGSDIRFSSDPNVQAQFEQIRNSVVGCIDATSAASLDAIGIQGGYYNMPEKAFDLKWAFIPYYYYEGTVNVPDKTKVEGEMTAYINENVKICLDSIDKGDFSISYNNPKTTVKIDTADVKFSIDMPVSISRETKTVVLSMKDYPLYYAVPLADILSLGNYIANESFEDNMVCLSCITKAASDKNLNVDLVNLENAGTLVVITSNNTAAGEYSLEFLNKYK